MNMRQEKRGDVLIYFPEKEINISNCKETKEALDEAMNKNEKKILLDLSGLSYIDSSGLAMLIEFGQRLKKNNGRMRLCSLDNKIKNVFTITKLDKFFEILDTQDLALKDF